MTKNLFIIIATIAVMMAFFGCPNNQEIDADNKKQGENHGNNNGSNDEDSFDFASRVYWCDMSSDNIYGSPQIQITFKTAEDFEFVMGGKYYGHIAGNAVTLKDQTGDAFGTGTISFGENFSSIVLIINVLDNQSVTFSGILEQDETNDEPVPNGTLTNNFGLAGTRYYCEELTTIETMSYQPYQRFVMKVEDVFNFMQNNTAASIETAGGFKYTEVIADNKIILTPLSGKGLLIGVISNESDTIEISGYVSFNPVGDTEVTHKLSGIYRKMTNVIDLTEKTYRTTSIKLNGEEITDLAYTLSFNTDMSFEMENDDDDIYGHNSYSGAYYNVGNKITFVVMSAGQSGFEGAKYDSISFNSVINTVISEDRKSLTMTAKTGEQTQIMTFALVE